MFSCVTALKIMHVCGTISAERILYHAHIASPRRCDQFHGVPSETAHANCTINVKRLWYNIRRADIVPRAPVCDAQPGQLTELLCKAAAAAGRLNDEMCKVSN